MSFRAEAGSATSGTRRTEKDSGNSEEQNGRMSARGLRLKASLEKASGGIHWIG